MKKEDLERVLSLEIDAWAVKPYEELTQMRKPHCYSTDVNGTTFNVEIQVLHVTSDYVQLSIAVDDGSGRWSTCPVAKSMLTYRDGHVDKPD